MGDLHWLRDASNQVFGRPHQLEVAQAVALLDDSFEAEEAIELVRNRARDEGEDPPAASSIRKSLRRLAVIRAVVHVESSRGTSDLWKREPSLFWDWLNELPSRIGR